MPDDARAFWITAPGRGEIRTQALPAAAFGDVIVRALYSGVSRGTESLVFGGRVPPSERERMRAPFQAGDFPAPVKYGYSSVGIVEHGPEALVGRTVFCLYPHQTRYVVPADAVCVVPDGVPAERAVLAANLETAINGLWDASIRVGDRVAVVGAGVVGCLAARVAAGVPGCRVELVDIDARKGTVAERLGLEFRSPAQARPGADLVVHASGSGDGLATALRVAGFEATVLELSWYGDGAVSIPLGEAFHSGRLKLVSSQVGAVAAAQRARWTHRRRLELALELLRDDALDALIESHGPFDALPERMAQLAHAPVLCHRVDYAA